MKKNFLKVAALLIAAMLLVVSCSQEVKAPENEDNGLVAVTLNTSVASKGLTFEGLDSVEGVVYTYTLDALWDDTNLDEKIIGEKSNVTISDINTSTKLGYLSQGYWNIKVEAKKDGKVVLSGETNQYITEGNASVTVFLNVAGTSNSTCTLSFDINVNNLSANTADYSLYYSIEGKKYNNETVTFGPTEITTKNQVAPDQGTTNPTYVTKFIGSKDGLQPGYYRVTVTLKKGETVIGGITRGFLLIDGDTEVKLMGSVSASDFVNSTLNVITAGVTISDVTAIVGEGSDLLTKNENEDSYEGQLTCTSSSNTETVVYSLTHSININTNIPGVTSVSGPTYIWMVDGEVAEDSDGNDATLTINFTPGDRYVTCIVNYTYTCTVGASTAEFPVSAWAYTHLRVYENGYVAPSN